MIPAAKALLRRCDNLRNRFTSAPGSDPPDDDALRRNTSMEGVGEVMLETQREGIARAKGEDKYKGRAPTARAKTADVRRLAAEGLTREAIAARLEIGVASVYRALRAG
jgi:hypothetical protein